MTQRSMAKTAWLLHPTRLGEGHVYQIYFNPLGTSFDQRIVMTEAGANADRTWNGTYEVKTARGRDYWTVEARIPLDQFGAVARSGQRMGLEFRRKQKRLNCTADWQVPLDYNPSTYGVMLLK